MQSHFASAAAVAVLALAAATFGSAAEEAGGGAWAQETLLAQATGYDPMRRALPSPDAAERPEGNPELEGLPDAPGAEDTYYLCSGCHSIALVKQQRLSDARWDYLWNWMIEEQGMPEMDDETRDAILGYLKDYFSSER